MICKLPVVVDEDVEVVCLEAADALCTAFKPNMGRPLESFGIYSVGFSSSTGADGATAAEIKTAPRLYI